MRHFARLVFIAVTLLRFGVDEIALGRVRQPWLRGLARLLSIGRSWDDPRGARLRLALTELGPIWVKAGQVLSTRRDLIPEDVADELAHLQDQVPPFPGEVARTIVEESLGKPIGALYASFDETPLASASIAQVHAARLLPLSRRAGDVPARMEAGSFDAADDWIVEHVQSGDIVVTADVPLAGRCVGKDALVTGPTGRLFDKANIGMATAMRDLGQHLRETGESKGYNAAFSPRDRSAFLETLERLCRRAKSSHGSSRESGQP